MQRLSGLSRRAALVATLGAVLVAAPIALISPAGAFVPQPPGAPGYQFGYQATNELATPNPGTNIVTDGHGHLFFSNATGVLVRSNLDGTGLHTLVTNLSSGNRELGLAIGPNGFLWVGDTINDNIYVVNPTTGAKTIAFNPGFAPNAIALDGRGHVFVGALGNAAIYRFSLDGSHRVTLATTVDPWGLSYDHAGHIYFANGYDGGGWRMNIDGSNQVEIISTPAILENVVVLADHSVLWSSYGDGQLWESTPDATYASKVADLSTAEGCAQDPQTLTLYCVTWSGGQLVRVKLSPQVTTGNQSATVTWTPSAPGTNATISYTVLVQQTNTGYLFDETVPATQRSATFYGLTNGQAYLATVFGTNGVGDGTYSVTTPVFVPGPSAPSAPTAVTATAGPGQLHVSWPASSGNGSAVSAYVVTVFDSDSWTVNQRITVPGSSTSATISGLFNGEPYHVLVSAINAVGDSSYSPFSADATPKAKPTWSSVPTATALSKSARVTWLAANANGSPITSYKVTATPSGHTCSTTTVLHCVVPGLTPGVSYKFKVTATNHIGTSAPSAASNAVVVLH